MGDGFFKVRSKWETYDIIVRFEFVWLALEMFWTKSLNVDECFVGAFDALDEDLHPNNEYNRHKGIQALSSNTPLCSPPIPQHA